MARVNRVGKKGNDHFNKPLKPNRLKYGTHVANDLKRVAGKGAGGLAGSAAELDAVNRGLPTGPGRKPSGPAKPSGGAGSDRLKSMVPKAKPKKESRKAAPVPAPRPKAAVPPSSGPKSERGKAQMPAAAGKGTGATRSKVFGPAKDEFRRGPLASRDK